MPITYFKENRLFKLDTPSTSYMFSIVDDENFVSHVYYGKRMEDGNLTYLLGIDNYPFTPSKNNRERVNFLDRLPVEYPVSGLGDFKESCLDISSADGYYGCNVSYVSHVIYEGKKKLAGLPATFADESECDTLELKCADHVLNLEITLTYNVFRELDVITRHVKIKNNSTEKVYLKKVLSACIDVENNDYEMIRLFGSWGRERSLSRVPIGYGKTVASSVRGISSHQEHPFIALVNKNTTQDAGDVYGLHLVYSGNFTAVADLYQFDRIRAVIGINPYNFSWCLDPASEFTSPEAVLTYSSEGLGKMTRTLHDLYRNHLIRGKYKDTKRPVLINNWEGTYFDFNTEKLLSMARDASKLGIELFVLDDGWFGTRDDDNTSLGDWTVNEKKLTGGLKYLAEEINKLGMKFGIWMEPEMVSLDSNLYRKHPDWAIAIPNRAAALSRNQYVLDLSRREVLDYIFESVSSVIKSANISYVKWDMNRALTDLGSCTLTNQGELYHKYMLGVYELQERLITEFPDLLLENCSSGGARFDPGMLHYSPQIWCSDDTDAIERLKIQEGTALIYPLSTMGAHVSDCPNHAVGRSTPFETRGIVALAGTFGYELDVTRIPESDREAIPKQIEMYHKYNDLVRRGDYYRIASYSENRCYDCWQVVSKDKSEALITYVRVLEWSRGLKHRVRLKGLDENAYYLNNADGKKYSGAALMYAGLNVKCPQGDFRAALIHITRI